MALAEETDAPNTDSLLALMARNGEVEIVTDEDTDKVRLTEKGKRGAEDVVTRLVSEYEETKDWDSVMKDLADALRKHGVCAVIGTGAALLKRGKFSFELRFQFIGGNKKLCDLNLGEANSGKG